MNPQNPPYAHVDTHVDAIIAEVVHRLLGDSSRRLNEKLIDHTNLRPEATPSDISRLCSEALEYGFASVCVNPIYVPQCATALSGSAVKVCTVIGFPLGATLTKSHEAKNAVEMGAQELDMVIRVGALKFGQWANVRDDIASVVEVSGPDVLVKVILEMCYLSEEEKVVGCVLAEESGADFVKTSTGFGSSGAEVGDVALMKAVVGERLGIKASGGIRDVATAEAMIAAGATRIGTSSGFSFFGTPKV